MTRKSMVLALAVVLVIAVAIPVVAQERTVLAPTLHGVAKRALKTSQKAAKRSTTAGAATSLPGSTPVGSAGTE